MSKLGKKVLNKKKLNETFIHDPETGGLYWRNPRQGRSRNREAGTHVNGGYRQVKFEGVLYYVHVIIWCMYHGDFNKEKNVIIHRNRDAADNRIEDLLKVERQKANRRPKMTVRGDHNKTPYRGVNRVISKNFRVTVSTPNGPLNLGCYETPEEAARVYDEWAKRFHKEDAILNFPDEER